jgi:hypothetical protein
MARHQIALVQTINFGPAMSALSPMRRAFVVAFNNAGGKNATEAGRAAGYKNTEHLRSTVHDLLHDANVQAAIIEDARARLAGDLHATLDIIDEIARNPQHKDRLAAAKVKLHHAGMVEVTKSEVAVTHTITLDQKIERYKALLAQTGSTPDPLLAPLLEGEYTDVTDDPEKIEW